MAQHALAQREEGRLHRRGRFRPGTLRLTVAGAVTAAARAPTVRAVPAGRGHARARVGCRVGTRARIGVVGACRLRSGHLKALPVSRLLLWAVSRSATGDCPVS
ncbi:hypothetical protein TPA0905_02050 [Streptomyces olivaceus]|nr:hypothetical protein TPA0905_02050 [Streptomyces olivaceus]